MIWAQPASSTAVETVTILSMKASRGTREAED
jgi:hypothetical protein